eukprot:gene24399-30743_t
MKVETSEVFFSFKTSQLKHFVYEQTILDLVAQFTDFSIEGVTAAQLLSSGLSSVMVQNFRFDFKLSHSLLAMIARRPDLTNPVVTQSTNGTATSPSVENGTSANDITKVSANTDATLPSTSSRTKGSKNKLTFATYLQMKHMIPGANRSSTTMLSPTPPTLVERKRTSLAAFNRSSLHTSTTNHSLAPTPVQRAHSASSSTVQTSPSQWPPPPQTAYVYDPNAFPALPSWSAASPQLQGQLQFSPQQSPYQVYQQQVQSPMQMYLPPPEPQMTSQQMGQQQFMPPQQQYGMPAPPSYGAPQMSAVNNVGYSGATSYSPQQPQQQAQWVQSAWSCAQVAETYPMQTTPQSAFVQFAQPPSGYVLDTSS